MPERKYADPSYYERKLRSVAERLGITVPNYDFSRRDAFIEFRYKEQLYRFDHGVEKAARVGLKLNFGSDAFAQLVLTLEDLARMVERGIYDLAPYIEGMRFLPPPTTIAQCFADLGFVTVPTSVEEVRTRFRNLSKTMHPDQGGTAAEFQRISDAAEDAIRRLS